MTKRRFEMETTVYLQLLRCCKGEIAKDVYWPPSTSNFIRVAWRRTEIVDRYAMGQNTAAKQRLDSTEAGEVNCIPIAMCCLFMYMCMYTAVVGSTCSAMSYDY